MVTPTTAVPEPTQASWAGEYPFASHWLEVEGGHAMHYVDEGPRDAPALVFVHGNPTWSFYYRELIKAFRGEFRCVAMDHIGCGLSDKPQQGYPYRLRRRIDDAERLVESLELERFTLVVHDWGGAIGMGVAARRPEAIERLVVFNTAAFRSERIPFSIDLCRIPLLGQLAVRGLNGFARVAQYRAIYDRKNLAGPVGDGYLAPYDSWENRVATHEFVLDIPMKPSHPSYDTLVEVEEGLAQFTDRPMLIVWGDDDFCFDPSFRREWERRFPDAEVHALPNAGHYVIEDATEATIGWMRDFFARTGGRRG